MHPRDSGARYLRAIYGRVLLSFSLAWLHSATNNVFTLTAIFHPFSYFQLLYRLEYRNIFPQEESRAHRGIVSSIKLSFNVLLVLSPRLSFGHVSTCPPWDTCEAFTCYAWCRRQTSQGFTPKPYLTLKSPWLIEVCQFYLTESNSGIHCTISGALSNMLAKALSLKTCENSD